MSAEVRTPVGYMHTIAMSHSSPELEERYNIYTLNSVKSYDIIHEKTLKLGLNGQVSTTTLSMHI